MPAPHAYFLVGPTAAGKSAVAHTLALRRNCAVLSVDSMLVYKGMDIGTDKPPLADRRAVTYLGLDIVEPDHDFNLQVYLDSVRAAASVLDQPMIAAGGTGLYVRCLLEGLRESAPPDPVIRSEAEAALAQGGVAALQELVRTRKPANWAALRDPENPRRLIRALEVADGVRPAWSRPPAVTGLRLESKVLQGRIEARVRRMYENGLLDEVRCLREKYPAWSETALQAIGYAEALAVLDGRRSLPDAMQATIIRTRQLAKRQMTWFRHQLQVHWIDVGSDDDAESIANRVKAHWEKHAPSELHL